MRVSAIAFDLIRLEDSGREATRNNYYVNSFRLRTSSAKQTEAEWEADVLSGDRHQSSPLASVAWRCSLGRGSA